MTATGVIASADYIRRETIISIVINMVFSLAFFLLIFGGPNSIPVWGTGGYAADLIPQSFVVALMSVLVPGALAARKLRAQQLGPLASGGRLPAKRTLRALILASSTVAAAVALLWPLLALSGLGQIAWWPALIGKLAFGGLIAAVITPIGLRAELAR